jgi:hypothetical protein
MYTEGLIPPLFSLAILRDVSGPSGYLALGGVPPIDFVQNFTSTPILITTIEGYPKTYDFYTININGAVLNFPTKVAYEINNAFKPPAVYSADDGAFIVDCNAKPPTFGINIGGVVFYTNPLDMILLAGTDEDGNDVCISGIDDGGSDTAADVYILGDTFQKNVVTVFDIGAGEVRFAEREYYPSNDPVKA